MYRSMCVNSVLASPILHCGLLYYVPYVYFLWFLPDTGLSLQRKAKS